MFHEEMLDQTYALMILWSMLILASPNIAPNVG